MSSGISRGSSIRLASWMLNRLSGADRPWEGHAVMVPKGSRYEFNEKQNRYELEYISPEPLSGCWPFPVTECVGPSQDLGLVEVRGIPGQQHFGGPSPREQRGSRRQLWGTVGLPDSRGA